ncbi:hypothetical protein AB835_01695 [Candidatus Endobugula sertula]|uniref:SSD domain-containing protein n=1 Tax=Candidatus Endobugula sertula TaxID=62101 RepID=A0A1D2QTA8_9GAMM|nr:hypothetical protein AB835_01695 [Candidatus Endobugula sertula]
MLTVKYPALSLYALDYPKRIFYIIGLLTVMVLLLAVTPNLFKALHPWISPLTIDTDPENMLPYDDEARAFHRQMKKVFELSDIIVVGVINESHPDGVFNPQTLKNIHHLSDAAQSIDGVISLDVLSLSTVDDIQNQEQEVVFDWLMTSPPVTQEEALSIKERTLRIPFLNNSLASDNGQALAIYLPISSKEKSYAIYRKLQDVIATLPKDVDDQFHITGLPVAEDVFGVEMFIQMAIIAPIAMLLIFVLLFFFFRNVAVAASALLVALVAVIWTMGSLVVSGQTIHIMSSMIPIFIMPIAVLDSVHIHSEFFDRYHVSKDRKAILQDIMSELHTPMLFTTLTTAVGFASLWLTPIPPIQVFGLFVALGVLVAWLVTITLVPAYLLMLSEKTLAHFGAKNGQNAFMNTWLNLGLMQLGRQAFSRSRIVLIIMVTISCIAAIGLKDIRVNDNPIKWFNSEHPIRVADTGLNQHIGGTYMAYLTFQAADKNTFKDPEVLRYMEGLQRHLLAMDVVGKVNSVTDIVKTVHREWFIDEADSFVVPDSQEAVAQLLLIYENSHRAHDLWKLVNRDFDRMNLWLQMNKGDNQHMDAVMMAANNYLQKNPPPLVMEHAWFGLTYINSVWQDKMVSGMLTALLSSFIVVFLIILLLFRSVLWSVLAIVPLSLTILVIYGVIGWMGRDYDMPIAVLSSLSLGLAIDYAIHFVSRSRWYLLSTQAGWKDVWPIMYAEPARAILRNIFIVGLGFLPLLLSPLVPYNTVGILIAAILLLAGFVTLWVLPALITVAEPALKTKKA